MPFEFHIGLGIPSLQPFWCVEPSPSLASQVMTPKGISLLGCVRNTSPPESVAWLTASSRSPAHPASPRTVCCSTLPGSYLRVSPEWVNSQLPPVRTHTQSYTPRHTLILLPSPPHTHTFLSSNLADQPRPHEMSTHVFWAQVNSDETLLNKELGCLPGCWKYPRDSETRVLSKHFIILLHT